MRRYLAAFALALLLLLPLLVPLKTSAFNPLGEACTGSSAKSSACTADGKDPLTGKDKQGVLIKAVNIFSYIAGIGAVLGIIIAGFEYVISAGDSNKVEKAKMAIIAACIGLAVVVFARIIINFVLLRL